MKPREEEIVDCIFFQEFKPHGETEFRTVNIWVPLNLNALTQLRVGPSELSAQKTPAEEPEQAEKIKQQKEDRDNLLDALRYAQAAHTQDAYGKLREAMMKNGFK